MKTSNVMIGEKRAPLNTSEVKLYTTPPTKYIEIAILSVDAGHDFKPDQTVMDEAVTRLKEEAAAIGANGVILTSLGEKGGGSGIGVGTGTAMVNGKMATNNSMMVITGQRFKNISGMAIFVTP
jgi:hypothetical protein